jgi:hypothetical protein
LRLSWKSRDVCVHIRLPSFSIFALQRALFAKFFPLGPIGLGWVVRKNATAFQNMLFWCHVRKGYVHFYLAHFGDSSEMDRNTADPLVFAVACGTFVLIIANLRWWHSEWMQNKRREQLRDQRSSVNSE